MTLQAFSGEVKFTPWWWEAAPLRSAREEILPERADVAIIGAGYTGLTAGLVLARAGRDVVIVDAEAPGHGASSRNGGQCGPGSQRSTAATLVARYGERKARNLLAESLAMLRHLGDFIEAEGIVCEFARVGRFRGAVAPRHYEALARDMQDMHRLAGVEFHMVPRAEQHAEVGSDFYHGGVVLPHDGALHPALYHRGLLERVEQAGARVLGYTPVAGIDREVGCFTVRTARGALRARNVLVASNGYTGGSLAGFASRVLPIGSAIIATEPQVAEVVRRLMPRNRVVGSSARIHHYMRLCPEGRRFLWGGRIKGWSLPTRPAGFLHLYRDMVRVFPELDGTRISHCWSGYVAYTQDVFPHLGECDGIHYAMGYCGSGVVRATWFGHKIALQMLGDRDGRTAFEDLVFRPFPAPSIARRVVPVVTQWYRLRDWMERRSSCGAPP